ncbi:MAG: D-alanine--D-alanine ligase [Lachnospiraceae bacterium]|nr:D-alanine--D-alanine ligase [Lachnospiraceae bacterium]MDE6626628.1 D-alanine--D-alanine ligase [Lachnospiraceae bacterium]
MDKLNIAIIFGGQSSEHDISCMSVQTVAGAVCTDRYDITYIGITKDGHWLLVDSLEDIADGSWVKSKASAILSPDATKRELILITEQGFSTRKIDVIFPVLHGMLGEDGTIQGLFEMTGIPYVGSGVLASAVGMDKVYTKIIVNTLGIAQADYVLVRAADVAEKALDIQVKRVEDKLDYPVFIKPSKAGSSQGVSKAHNREELIAGLRLAAQHDTKILVERNIVGREIECAVLGSAVKPEASGVGEILAAAEFYDFDAKYSSEESKTVISPELPAGKAEEIQKAAKAIFSAVDGYGLARVDFFLEKDTDRVIFNEINTLPGFTAISMYPMLWEAEGLKLEELVEKQIQLAFEREKI